MDYAAALGVFFAEPPAAVTDPAPAATPARRLRDALEPVAMHAVWSERVNTAQDTLVAALGADLDGVTAALAGWSQRCVEARAFPPDPGKRAAG